MKILAAESRQRYNIVEPLCATEPRHGERKVRRDNKHNCFFDAGCSLVKYPSRLLASGRIETGNNVKDFSLAGVICERYIRQILVGQREIGDRLALRRQTARYRYRFAFQRYSGHVVPFSKCKRGSTLNVRLSCILKSLRKYALLWRQAVLRYWNA